MKELRCPSCGAPYSVSGICAHCGNKTKLSKKELKALKENLKANRYADDTVRREVEQQAITRNFMIKRKEKLDERNESVAATIFWTFIFGTCIYLRNNPQVVYNLFGYTKKVFDVLHYLEPISGIFSLISLLGIAVNQSELKGDSMKKYKRDLRRINNGEIIIK